MAYRLLLDEHLEHETVHRLESYGHDVEQVDFVPELGKGTDDRSIADYSLDTDRLIVTYDDDFVLEFDDADYRGVIYLADATLTSQAVAAIVDRMSETIPQHQLQGLAYASTDWL